MRKRTQTAIVLSGLGIAAIAAGVRYPATRTALFVLGGILFFSAVSTYLLLSEAVVRESVYEGVYDTLLTNEVALIRECGLNGSPTYVPRPTEDALRKGDSPVRLFVPRDDDESIVDADLDSLFVPSSNGRDLGVSLRPIGSNLFAEFESMTKGEVGGSVNKLVTQLADGLVGGLELVDSVATDVDPDQQRAVFMISDSATPIGRFDHPVQSFLGVGMALTLGSPVRAEIESAENSRFAYVVVCDWDDTTHSRNVGQFAVESP